MFVDFMDFSKPEGVLVLIVNGNNAIFQFIYGTLFLIYSPLDKNVTLIYLGFFLTYVYIYGRVLISCITNICINNWKVFEYVLCECVLIESISGVYQVNLSFIIKYREPSL